MFKRYITITLISLTLLLTSSLVKAQAISTSKFFWDQIGSSLAEVNGFTYKYYADGSTTGVALTNVVCTGTASPFSCSVGVPAFIPGSHTLTLTTSNLAGESPKSNPLAFTFVVIPNAPSNIRIQ